MVEKYEVEMSFLEGLHFNPRLFNHKFFNPMVQKFMVEKSRVEKFMIEKSGVERSGVEKSGVEMSFNLVNNIDDNRTPSIVFHALGFSMCKCSKL